MAKGAAIKFTSYSESVQKLLELLNLHYEIKKYDKIVLKPYLSYQEESTPVDFTEEVLKFCLKHKNPVGDIFIAEGAEGASTTDLFNSLGYSKLAEKYPVSLIDLNDTEVDDVQHDLFKKFSSINYPSILRESFIISLPKIREDAETVIHGSLSNMLGAFPSRYYSGFFSRNKNKIRKWPLKFSIHDVLVCKMPDFAVVDASSQGSIFAGLPFEIDKRIAKSLGKEWQRVPYLNLLHEEFQEELLANNKLY